MYSYISGELVEIGADHIVVDNQGIGYRFYVAASVINRLPHVGSPLKIYTYLQVREDDMSLFGFLAKDELELFQMLIGVNGIGPKAALAILGTLSADDLRFAILADDAKAIAAAPGVGPKTAKRVILDLKDKLDFLEAFETRREHAAEDADLQAGKVHEIRHEVVLALTSLGYASSDVLKAMQDMEISEEDQVEDLLKVTLRKMALL